MSLDSFGDIGGGQAGSQVLIVIDRKTTEADELLEFKMQEDHQNRKAAEAKATANIKSKKNKKIVLKVQEQEKK